MWHFLKKLNIELPYDPAILLLGKYQEKWKYVHTKTCTQMFIATLFIIAEKWKQSKCSTTDEWINKMLYICAIEYYLATKVIKYWHRIQHGWYLKTCQVKVARHKRSHVI